MLPMPTQPATPIPVRPILVVDDDAKIVRLVRTYLERDGFSVVTAADGPDDGPAVQLGEHQVEDDERRAVALDGVEGGRAVGGGHDGEAVALEVRPHEPDDLGVVVDDEDRSFGDGHGWLDRHREHRRGAMLGGLRDGLVTRWLGGRVRRRAAARHPPPVARHPSR